MWTIVEKMYAHGQSKLYSGQVETVREVSSLPCSPAAGKYTRDCCMVWLPLQWLYVLVCIVALDYIHDTWYQLLPCLYTTFTHLLPPAPKP